MSGLSYKPLYRSSPELSINPYFSGIAYTLIDNTMNVTFNPSEITPQSIQSFILEMRIRYNLDITVQIAQYLSGVHPDIAFELML